MRRVIVLQAGKKTLFDCPGLVETIKWTFAIIHSQPLSVGKILLRGGKVTVRQP